MDLWFGAEEEFHDTLISACGSATLIDTHKRVFRQFRQQLMVEDQKFDFISANIQHHSEILQAALSGDEALAREKIHHHLKRHLEAQVVPAGCGGWKPPTLRKIVLHIDLNDLVKAGFGLETKRDRALGREITGPAADDFHDRFVRLRFDQVHRLLARDPAQGFDLFGHGGTARAC